MYANDLAYYDGVDEETYNRNSPELNVLQIAWRLELINQVSNSHQTDNNFDFFSLQFVYQFFFHTSSINESHIYLTS